MKPNAIAAVLSTLAAGPTQSAVPGTHHGRAFAGRSLGLR